MSDDRHDLLKQKMFRIGERQRQKQPHRSSRIDRVTLYQANRSLSWVEPTNRIDLRLSDFQRLGANRNHGRFPHEWRHCLLVYENKEQCRNNSRRKSVIRHSGSNRTENSLKGTRLPRWGCLDRDTMTTPCLLILHSFRIPWFRKPLPLRHRHAQNRFQLGGLHSSRI
jgi:hypothetical protein